MKIIQIMGTNASGKTTVVKQLLKQSTDIRYLSTPPTYKDVYATIAEDISLVALGKYDDAKMGGCDRIRFGVEYIKSILTGFARGWGAYDLVFEGMMISTIKSTFYNHLLYLRDRYEIKPIFVYMDTSMQNAINRLKLRGTTKNISDDLINNVGNKITTIKRHVESYDQQYVRYFPVDDTDESDMLFTFKRLIGE